MSVFGLLICVGDASSNSDPAVVYTAWQYNTPLTLDKKHLALVLSGSGYNWNSFWSQMQLQVFTSYSSDW